MGTTIHIKIPLTMAIIPGQIISIENQKFVIPQTNLMELIRIPADQVKKRLEWVGDAQVIRLRDRLLPLVRLADVLGIKRTYTDPSSAGPRPDRRRNIADRRSRKSPLFGSKKKGKPDAPKPAKRAAPRFQSDRRYRADSALNIAVLSTGLLRYGIIVDRFLDSEEIVVKPLGRHLKDTRAYAGATIMGDGQVALILDSGDIARIAEMASIEGTDRALEVAEATEGSDTLDGEVLDLLVFQNAEHERFAIPLSQVVRIERIEKRAIETYGRRRTIQYRGGNLPVFSIDETADVNPLPQKKHLLVIVSRVAGREVGLLALGPVDSVSTVSAVDPTSFKQPGIMGSIIIHKETALVVDLKDVITHLYPEWISEDPEKASAYGTAGTLLVVEDSTFFRSQITSFLQNNGFAVMEAEDGLAAWELLKSREEEIDLIITDIEMPNMDGLELTKKVKAEEGLSTIPIIALTTLADDQDEEK
jgi:two-component system chemotaxis sensor kinase CheA